MKTLFSATALLSAILITSLCFAVPTLTIPAFKDVGSNVATLTLKSSENGTGYFTLLPGNSANCGTGTKVAFGPYSTGSSHGSRPLFANVSGSYTVRNLSSNAPYTACFTADSPSGLNLNPSPVSANLTTAAATALTGLDWRTTGSAGFSTGTASFISLAFAPDGTPHIAFSDESDNGKAKVMKYSEGSWSVVGADGFSAGRANYPSLAFSPDGVPHVAYGDDSLAGADKGKATVMRYNGTWGLLGPPGFSAAPASSLSLAFAPDGIPHVAFSGDDYNTNRQPVVMKFSGGWNMAGSTAVSSGNARFTSLAFAPGGTPYVAYADDGASGKVSVKKLNGATWESVSGPGFSVYDTAYVSLAISPDGTPHVAYADYGLGGKAVVKKYSGSVWEAVGAEVSTGQAMFNSLAFSPDGKPCVAYVDIDGAGKVNARQYDGAQWIQTGSADFSSGTANFTSLAFAPDGIPYVAYSDDGNGSKTTVMYLDTPAPETSITGKPVNPTTSTDATFTFSSSDLAASFECQLDGSQFTSCMSGVSYSGLAQGGHTFNVRAVNTKGNSDPTPASYSWTINSSAPTVVKIGANNYSTLAAALGAAQDGNTLQIRDNIIPEVVNYDGSGIITLEGGYNSGWGRSTTLFSPVSSMIITNGTLIIDQIIVQ